jgi:hypothetical protein
MIHVLVNRENQWGGNKGRKFLKGLNVKRGCIRDILIPWFFDESL